MKTRFYTLDQVAGLASRTREAIEAAVSSGELLAIRSADGSVRVPGPSFDRWRSGSMFAAGPARMRRGVISRPRIGEGETLP